MEYALQLSWNDRGELGLREALATGPGRSGRLWYRPEPLLE